MTPTHGKTNVSDFSIPLQEGTELGQAMLIAEDDEGNQEPLAVVGTIREGRELAATDMRARVRGFERGEDVGICPTLYRVWARGKDGSYRVAIEIADPLK